MFVSIAVSLVIVAAFELDILQEYQGILTGDKNAEFLLQSLMIIIMVVSIPLSLKMFKYKKVKELLTAGASPEKKLLRWGSLRMLMLCVPMVADTLFYYLFMQTTFGYMGIITLLCLSFVYPSSDRCLNETSPDE